MAQVLCTTRRLEAYGAPQVTARYVEALRAAGHDVEVVYGFEPVAGTASIKPELDALDVPYRRLPRLGWGVFPGLCPALDAAVAKSDLVISNQLSDLPAAGAAGLRVGVPSLLFVQNDPHFGGMFPIGHIKKWLYRRAVSEHGTRIVAVAHGVRDRLVKDFGVPASRADAVPNGLDLDEFPASDETARAELRGELGLAEDTRLVVNLGRIHRQKGQDVFLEALGKLRAEGRMPDAKVVLLGNGEPKLTDSLKARCTALGLDDDVVFAGFRKDAVRFLFAADLFVLPSRWEGLPLSVLESFAARCPVLMTEYGAKFPDFRDGVDGWYVPKENPAALADGFEKCLACSSDELRSVGENGRAYLEEHLTLDRAKADFVAIVEEMLADGGQMGVSREPAEVSA